MPPEGDTITTPAPADDPAPADAGGTSLLTGILLAPEEPEPAALQRALDELRSERALLSELLLIERESLRAFVSHAARAAARLRALLRQRAREPAQFRRKLERLRRLHARLAARALALPLATLAAQLDHTARALSLASAVDVPSGDELLPALVLIEDNLLALSWIATRTGLPFAAQRRERRASATRTTRNGALRGAQPRVALALQQLAARLAGEQGKQIELTTLGLEQIPEDYSGAVYDVYSQLLRNAIEHGVEMPSRRTEAGKLAAATLLAECHRRHGGELELVFQDDGQGLQSERILRAGIDAGLIDSDGAAALDARQATTLIFRTGLSTATDPAGRGLGMRIVRDHVRRLQGQIQVATKRGQFTRVRIRLPAPADATATAERNGAAAPAG